MHESRLSHLLGPPDSCFEVERGATVFRRDDPVTAVYEVLVGRVRLERTPADGTVLVLGVLLPGEALAEASIFATSYHCDAVAEVGSRLASWSRGRVSERLSSEPDLTRRWLARSCRQVQQLRALVELRSLRPLTERILAWLRMREEGVWVGAADKPLRAVADELGVSPEAFYRALAELEKQGSVRRRGRVITRNS